MMKLQSTIVIFTSIVLIGCAPLQQAPLVYSSKLAIGLDVTTNTAENPGASITIGVKTVDAAYVPVAVSKDIDARSNKDAQTIEIQKIFAQYGQGSNGDTIDKLTEDNKTKISEFLLAKSEADKAATDLANTQIEYSSLQNKLSKLVQSTIILNKINDANTNIKDDDSYSLVAEPLVKTFNENEVPALTALRISSVNILDRSDTTQRFNVSQQFQDLENQKIPLKALINEVDKDITTLKPLSESKKVEADKKLSQAAKAVSLFQTSKTDALSVYGRFDSNGSGGANVVGTESKPNASSQLLVGKVFSTGLASQNLTEAAKLEALSKCVVSVLETSKTFSDDTKRQAFLSEFSKICTGVAEASRTSAR